MTAFITENENEEDFSEQRTFPRHSLNCPAIYRLGTNKRWLVAKMVEYSATGISMACDEDLPKGVSIDVQIKPGSVKTIPPMSLEGTVVRSSLNDEDRYVISVKIIKVLRTPQQ